jgi:hypothetical protein
MRWLGIILLVTVLTMVSCATRPEQTGPAEAGAGEFQPAPLDDDWSRWIVGRWQGSLAEDPNRLWDATIESDLNGQFLVYRTEAELTEMSPEEMQYLKKHSGATDESIARFRSLPFRELEIHTVDPQTGEIVGYLFDSLRCVAVGRGKRQGDTETINWQWSVGGRGTSTRATERVGDNEAIVTEKATLPDGSVTEGKGRMVRKTPHERMDPNDLVRVP